MLHEILDKTKSPKSDDRYFAINIIKSCSTREMDRFIDYLCISFVNEFDLGDKADYRVMSCILSAIHRFAYLCRSYSVYKPIASIEFLIKQIENNWEICNIEAGMAIESINEMKKRFQEKEKGFNK